MGEAVPLAGTAGGHPANQRRRRAGASDEVWPVREGVPPVIEASTEEPNHDPGPGVIGIDR
jgi:hypothetical protein